MTNEAKKKLIRQEPLVLLHYPSLLLSKCTIFIFKERNQNDGEDNLRLDSHLFLRFDPRDDVFRSPRQRAASKGNTLCP